MSRALGQLGRLARQAITQASEQPGASGLTRAAHTEVNPVSGRYSPNQFAKTAPIDRSATWMPKNPYLEAWVTRRDKYEREFTWTTRNTVEMLWFLGGTALGFWYLSVWTLQQADAVNHYPQRHMVFRPSKTGFIAPDERDWY